MSMAQMELHTGSRSLMSCTFDVLNTSRGWEYACRWYADEVMHSKKIGGVSTIDGYFWGGGGGGVYMRTIFTWLGFIKGFLRRF